MKTAFITGASQGLGREILAEFSRHGYFVIATSNRGKVELPGPGKVIPCDLSDAAAIKNAFAEIDRLDVLVNNARLDPSSRREGEDDASWFDRNIAVSLRGSYLCALEALRIMSSQRPSGGAIVNVSSIRAVIPNDRERIPEERLKAVNATIPLGRPGTMQECAETVRFAAEQTYMTGSCLNVSGGLLML